MTKEIIWNLEDGPSCLPEFHTISGSVMGELELTIGKNERHSYWLRNKDYILLCGRMLNQIVQHNPDDIVKVLSVLTKDYCIDAGVKLSIVGAVAAALAAGLPPQQNQQTGIPPVMEE